MQCRLPFSCCNKQIAMIFRSVFHRQICFYCPPHLWHIPDDDTKLEHWFSTDGLLHLINGRWAPPCYIKRNTTQLTAAFLNAFELPNHHVTLSVFRMGMLLLVQLKWRTNDQLCRVFLTLYAQVTISVNWYASLSATASATTSATWSMEPGVSEAMATSSASRANVWWVPSSSSFSLRYHTIRRACAIESKNIQNVVSTAYRRTRHIAGHFEGESFQAINCTGTDYQTHEQPRENTQKSFKK